MMNIAIIGMSGCGKTSYLNRIINGKFSASYKNTEFMVIHKILFCTDNMNIHDTNGCELTIPTTGIDGYIVMFDMTSKLSHETALKLSNKIPINIPRILCGNKADSYNICVNPRNFIVISAKCRYNLHVPLHIIINKIYGREVKFVMSNYIYRK